MLAPEHLHRNHSSPATPNPRLRAEIGRCLEVPGRQCRVKTAYLCRIQNLIVFECRPYKWSGRIREHPMQRNRALFLRRQIEVDKVRAGSAELVMRLPQEYRRVPAADVI